MGSVFEGTIHRYVTASGAMSWAKKALV